HVREAIARVVDLIRPPRHIDAQQPVLSGWKADYYLGIVRAIRLALDRLKSEQFDALLTALLRDPEEGVRWALAQTVNALPIALNRRIAITTALLNDQHIWVRQAMIEEVPSDLVSQSAEVRHCIIDTVTDSDGEVRLALALAAVRLRSAPG